MPDEFRPDLVRYYITLIRCAVGLEQIPKDAPRVYTVAELVLEEHKGMLDHLYGTLSGYEREVVDRQVMACRQWIQNVLWSREDYRDEMMRQWRHARLEANPVTREHDYGARVVLEALLDQFFPGWRAQA